MQSKKLCSWGKKSNLQKNHGNQALINSEIKAHLMHWLHLKVNDCTTIFYLQTMAKGTTRVPLSSSKRWTADLRTVFLLCTRSAISCSSVLKRQDFTTHRLNQSASTNFSYQRKIICVIFFQVEPLWTWNFLFEKENLFPCSHFLYFSY